MKQRNISGLAASERATGIVRASERPESCAASRGPSKHASQQMHCPSSKHRGPRNKCSWSGHDAHPTAGPLCLDSLDIPDYTWRDGDVNLVIARDREEASHIDPEPEPLPGMGTGTGRVPAPLADCCGGVGVKTVAHCWPSRTSLENAS